MKIYSFSIKETALPKFTLQQEDKLSIQLTHHIRKGEFRRIDLYLLLPNEMGINKDTLSETDYFNAGITGRRAYYTDGLHLPSLHERFPVDAKQSFNAYKTSLNLFAYQYIVALETDANTLLTMDDNDLSDFYDELNALMEHCLDILKKHRAQKPTETKLLAVYENVDNYLSWYTEQTLMQLLVNRPRVSAFSDNRLAILSVCDEEQQYRQKNVYNSDATLKDPNRIANKMRLIRRLIEYGVIFKSQTTVLGNISRKITTGVATALLMSVVLVLIIKTQGAFNHLTTLMIFTLAIIYGAREVFKDDLKNMLWHWIQRGKPKWSRLLSDSINQQEIAKQNVWLDYSKQSKLPQQAKDLLAERHIQHKQSAELLHYRIESRVNKKGFQWLRYHGRNDHF